MTTVKTYRSIPYTIAVFFVLLILLMAYLIWLAKHDYPGEVTKNAYEKGLKYNNAIAKFTEQEQLGWQGDIHFTAKGLDVTLLTTLTDKSGKPLEDAAVKAWFIRPIHAGKEDPITLIAQGKGMYSGKITLGWQGEWEVHISATKAGHNYQQVKMINVQ